MDNNHTKLLLLTHSFPYGQGETFLEDEYPYLVKHFHTITIQPLINNGPSRLNTSSHTTILPPLLNFSPKNKKALLLHGLLNTAPLAIDLHEYIKNKVYKSKRKTWIYFTSILTIRAILAKNAKTLTQAITQTDILYSYWADKTIDTLPILKKHITKLPTIITRFHGSDLYQEAKGYIPFRERLFTNIDIACPISQNGADYLQQHYPGQLKTIKTSHLASKNHHLSPPPAEPGATPHILSCSSIIPIKQLKTIANAIQHSTRPLHWTHIGDGPLRNTIENIKPDNPDTKTEILGWLTKDQIFQYYHTHHIDIFINTSRSEGIPVSIMEAISFGIPILATNIGGEPEIITPATGQLIPPDTTPQQLLQHIYHQLDKTPQQKQEQQNKAIHEWNQKWNADNTYEQFATYLSKQTPKT